MNIRDAKLVGHLLSGRICVESVLSNNPCESGDDADRPHTWGGYWDRIRPLGAIKNSPKGAIITRLLMDAGARPMTRDMIRGLNNALNGGLLNVGSDDYGTKSAKKIGEMGGITTKPDYRNPGIPAIEDYIREASRADLWYTVTYYHGLIIFRGKPNDLLDKFDAAAKVPIRRTGW